MGVPPDRVTWVSNGGNSLLMQSIFFLRHLPSVSVFVYNNNAIEHGFTPGRCLMSRHSFISMAFTVAAALGTSGFAQTAPQGSEATPSTLPATVAMTAPVPPIDSLHAVTAKASVLIFPFVTLNFAEDQQWMGRAIQEDMITEFGRARVFSPFAYHGQLLVEDNDTAIAIAHKFSADFVIRGAAQMVEKDLRLTAQFIDVSTGESIATASSTGSVKDLLKLEDQLSAELRTSVMAVAAAQAAQQEYGDAYSAAAQPSAAADYASGNAPYYTPTYASTGYDYGYYPYPAYGYVSSPVIFFGGRFCFFPNRGGFHGHSDFHGGGSGHVGWSGSGFVTPAFPGGMGPVTGNVAASGFNGGVVGGFSNGGFSSGGGFSRGGFSHAGVSDGFSHGGGGGFGGGHR
jgi:TolB-like protein